MLNETNKLTELEALDIDEVLRRTVKKGNSSAHIFLPKKYENREVVIFIKKEKQKIEWLKENLKIPVFVAKKNNGVEYIEK